MLIVLTGKMGVGKTSFLKEFGYGNIIHMDDAIKNEYKRSGKLYSKIKKTFGKKYVGLTKVNTKKLGMLVFKDPSEMTKLEKITMPFIKKTLESLKNDEVNIVEMGSYINYEKEYKKYFDKVVLLEGVIFNDKLRHIEKEFQPVKDSKIKTDLILQNSDWEGSMIQMYDFVRSFKDFE